MYWYLHETQFSWFSKGTAVGHGIRPKMVGSSMNNDLEGTWKEAVLAFLKWFSGICLEGLGKTTKQLSENIWCLYRYRTQYVQNTGQVLYMCIGVYVGVYVCMYVCMHVLCMYYIMYVCVCVCMYVYVCIMYVYVCYIMYVCIYACMYYVCVYVCMRVLYNVRMQVCMCMYACMYYVCMYACII